MKIMHIGLATHFTEGLGYQDNLLSSQNAKDGHTVVFVADCQKYEHGVLVETPPEDRVLSDGVRLVRVPYDYILTDRISQAVRKSRELIKIVETFKPDVIFCHGTQTIELLNLVKYKKKNANVRLFADSHADYINSAKTFVSRYILHKILYKYIAQKAYPNLDALYYISYDTQTFLKEMYALSDRKMRFFPLGGQLKSRDERSHMRSVVRSALGLTDENLLFLVAGKLRKEKEIAGLLETFFKVRDLRPVLVVIGQIPDEEKTELQPLIERDRRIQYLGWKSTSELTNYLCASDLYLQPKCQSATLQNALCCGTPVMVYPYESHKPYVDGNGFFVQTQEEIFTVFQQVLHAPHQLVQMSEKSFEIASKLLDYKMLASYLY